MFAQQVFLPLVVDADRVDAAALEQFRQLFTYEYNVAELRAEQTAARLELLVRIGKWTWTSNHGQNQGKASTSATTATTTTSNSTSTDRNTFRGTTTSRKDDATTTTIPTPPSSPSSSPQILILASERDRLLDSVTEAKRVAQEMIQDVSVEVRILQGASHAAALERDVDLVSEMMATTSPRTYEEEGDRKMPSTTSTTTTPRHISAAVTAKSTSETNVAAVKHHQISGLFGVPPANDRDWDILTRAFKVYANPEPPVVMGSDRLQSALRFVNHHHDEGDDHQDGHDDHTPIHAQTGQMTRDGDGEGEGRGGGGGGDSQTNSSSHPFRSPPPPSRRRRGILLVGNHTQFGWYDVPQLLATLRDLDAEPRSLGHPGHWRNFPPLGALFERFGAVPATARNALRLLEQGHVVLLFPGGSREVNKRRHESYQLMWSDQPTLVRLAIKADAVILPFAALGGDEAYDLLADTDEILAHPWWGRVARDLAKRLDIPERELGEVVPPVARMPISLPGGGNWPVGVPLLPFPTRRERVYFHFGDAIDPTHAVDEEEEDVNNAERDFEPRVSYPDVGEGKDDGTTTFVLTKGRKGGRRLGDRDRAQVVYQRVQCAVYDGLRVLKERRSRDQSEKGK